MADPAAARAYHAAVRALEQRGRFGIRLGLGRTRALLHVMGDEAIDLSLVKPFRVLAREVE